MNETFTNLTSSNCLGITNDGIVCRYNNQSTFFPYGSITKIKYSLGSLVIAGRGNGKIVSSVFMPSMKGDKKRIKELLPFVEAKMKNAEPGEAVILPPDKS